MSFLCVPHVAAAQGHGEEADWGQEAERQRSDCPRSRQGCTQRSALSALGRRENNGFLVWWHWQGLSSDVSHETVTYIWQFASWLNCITEIWLLTFCRGRIDSDCLLNAKRTDSGCLFRPTGGFIFQKSQQQNPEMALQCVGTAGLWVIFLFISVCVSVSMHAYISVFMCVNACLHFCVCVCKCMLTFQCLYVCVYACIHSAFMCVNACFHFWVCVSVSMRAYISVFVYLYLCVLTFLCLCVCVYACLHLCVCGIALVHTGISWGKSTCCPFTSSSVVSWNSYLSHLY